MEYTIGLHGFSSLKEVVQTAAHGIWQARDRRKLLASANDDWLIAERFVSPSHEQIQQAAHDVSLHRASDGTEGDDYHDWLYAELVLAVQAYQKLRQDGFAPALDLLSDREFRMGL